MSSANAKQSLTSEEFNLKAFQSDVLVALVGLQKLDTTVLSENSQVSIRDDETDEEIRRLIDLWDIENDAVQVYLQKEKTTEEAKEVIKREDIRTRLCPALSTLVDDAFEIAKVITPILAPFALAGSIPLNAALFAAVALVITRMSISTVCKGHKRENERKA